MAPSWGHFVFLPSAVADEDPVRPTQPRSGMLAGSSRSERAESHPLRQQVWPSKSLQPETVEGLVLSEGYVTLSAPVTDRNFVVIVVPLESSVPADFIQSRPGPVLIAELPRNPNGKILKRQLRKQYADAIG